MTQPDAHPYRDFEHAGWERAASAYADTFEAATRLFARPLLEAVGVHARMPPQTHPKTQPQMHPQMHLLDVACGTGFVAAAAAAHGASAFGVDFSASMVAQARQRHPALQFQEADAEALPFAAESFDAVVINFGVHHFPFPQRALAQAHRVLRTGGQVAFTVWSTPDDHALHKITLGALAEAGVAGAALPTPPGGAINDAAVCLRLLHDAGFAAPPARAERVSLPLELDSEQSLVDMLVAGTVRVSTLIRMQPPAQVAAIKTAMLRAAAAYRDGDRLRVPVTAILAVGSKR